MSRGLQAKRNNDWKKAIRKKNISDAWMMASVYKVPYYSELHMYSKGKIHCSCAICAMKSKNKGIRRSKNYNPSYNWSTKDMFKINRLADQQCEFFDNEVVS